MAEVKGALNEVILFQVDAEKGDGVELAKKYQVKGYPTFVLVNSSEEPIDRWLGYAKDFFLETMESALSDLSTIDEKTKRFTDTPNVNDADVLGRYNYALGEYISSVKYYRQAQQLNKDESKDYSNKIFQSALRGAYRDQFTYDEVAEAASAVFNSDKKESIVSTALSIANFARRNEKTEDMEKYLKLGLEASSDNDDPDIQQNHYLMQADYNLYVTGDKEAAVDFKKKTLKEGWNEDARGLNGFAWWCYENTVNLDEAETLARKSAELSEPGKSKAMILDTVAHILKAKGDFEEAIKVMEMAMAEDPDNEQWVETRDKFKKEMESQN